MNIVSLLKQLLIYLKFSCVHWTFILISSTTSVLGVFKLPPTVSGSLISVELNSSIQTSWEVLMEGKPRSSMLISFRLDWRHCCFIFPDENIIHYLFRSKRLLEHLRLSVRSLAPKSQIISKSSMWQEENLIWLDKNKPWQTRAYQIRPGQPRTNK